MLFKKMSRLAAAAAATALLATGCATGTDQPVADDGMLHVVATTGYLGDIVANVAPDADLDVLVKPGGDPHTQELTTQDTQKLNDADVVIWTSHDMEHHMMEQLDKLGEKQVPAAEAIPEDMLLEWVEDGQISGHDPHVWNSPDAWQYVVTATADKLAEIDPDNKDTYMENAEKYSEEIDEIRDYAEEQLSKIPENKRVLITGHDAFNYLGDQFGLEIYATDFVSSEAQMSAQEIDELAQLVADKEVKVIFQDNLSNPEAINHLKEAVKEKGGEVEISDKELFADSLGAEPPVDTYIGVMRHNIDAIVEALNS